jgi:hypothetical protein
MQTRGTEVADWLMEKVQAVITESVTLPKVLHEKWNWDNICNQ